MPRYKCYSCMKEFDSQRSFPVVQSGGHCPRCFTLITDRVNRVREPSAGRPRSNSAPDVLSLQRPPRHSHGKVTAPAPQKETSAHLVQHWCRTQVAPVKSGKFTVHFEQEFQKAVSRLEIPEKTLISVCTITSVQPTHAGQAVLLFRFYDGNETGLLPPSAHSYDPVQVPTGSSVGSTTAHQEGLKSGSNYISMSGNLPGLISTSCANVKGIVHGLSQEHRRLLEKGIKIHGLSDRQAPVIGVFLVPSGLWKIDHNLRSEKAHLSIAENEVLFDASKGHALKEFLLFNVPNPFFRGAIGLNSVWS